MSSLVRLAAIASVLLGAERAATAAPYTLPTLGWTIDVPGPERWTVGADEVIRADTLSATDPQVVILVERLPNSCGEEAATSIDLFGRLSSLVYEETPPWLSVEWFPAVSTNLDSDGLRLRRYCRELTADSSLLVLTRAAPDADPSGPVSRVLAALEVEVTAQGASGVDYPGNSAEAVAELNGRLAEVRGERTAAPPPTSPPAPYQPAGAGVAVPPMHAAPVATPGEDGRSYDGGAARPGRYDAWRMILSAASVSMAGVDADLDHLGASLHLPPRYRRARSQLGWTYGARASIGKLGEALVGDGHATLGVAIGRPRTQLAAAIVLGYEQVATDANGTSDRTGYGGLQLLLRAQVVSGLGVEGCVSRLTTGLGAEARYELSAVTLWFAPVSVVIGVHRDSGPGAMSLTGVHLGLGY